MKSAHNRPTEWTETAELEAVEDLLNKSYLGYYGSIVKQV